MEAKKPLTKQKTPGSVLSGERKPPRGVSFSYRPPSHRLGAYRASAKRHEPSLSIFVRARSAFAWSATETTIHAGSGSLMVRTGESKKHFNALELSQFYVARSTSASGFAVLARLENQDIVIADDLRPERVATFIEQLLEEFFDLVDRPDLDLAKRLATAPSKVLFNSGGVRAELVEGAEHSEDLAHLRIRTTRPIGCAIPIIVFMLVHNVLFFGGLFGSASGVLGAVVSVAVGVFWLFWLVRALINRTMLLADDRTLSLRTGPLSLKRQPLVTLRDIDSVEVEKTDVEINGEPRYRIVLKLEAEKVQVLDLLPYESAKALGGILEDHIIEARA